MEITIGKDLVLFDLQLPRGAKPLVMRWIEAGSFVMGSPENEPGRSDGEERQFKAVLSQGFWLGQYPVTQAHWDFVMGYNPSLFRQEGINCPVDSVSWYDAIMFCEALNRAFVGELPLEYRFSLPTEVQWEYACRAGTKSMYYSGNTEYDLARIAWYEGNSEGHTHSVGEKEPNEWGLYDMQGNVVEWCFDSPSDYPEGQAIDWMGPEDYEVRNFRSGAWGTPYNDGEDFRSGCRGYGPPEVKRAWFGFRLSLRHLSRL